MFVECGCGRGELGEEAVRAAQEGFFSCCRLVCLRGSNDRRVEGEESQLMMTRSV